MDQMFGLNGQVGVYGVKNNAKKWVNELLGDEIVSLPDGAGKPEISTKISESWTNDEWLTEANAIRNLLGVMEELHTPEEGFNYDMVYECQDAAELKKFFNAITSSYATRASIADIMINAMDLDKTGKVKEGLEAVGGSEFQNVLDAHKLDKTSYNEEFWEANLDKFADAIAKANQEIYAVKA